MSKQLVYYNPIDMYSLENMENYPELADRQRLMKMFNPSISFFDRTGTLEWPFRVKNLFPMPKNHHTDKTFATICRETMDRVIDHANANPDKEFVVMYSGGIDSTLLMVLLLQQADKALLDRTLVILNENSIQENSAFYEQHIKRRFRMASSNRFEQYLDPKYIVLTGEFADNVFGSLTLNMAMDSLGDRSIIHAPDKDYAHQFFLKKLGTNLQVEVAMADIEAICKVCPFTIDSMHDYMWWINFTMKWQAVYFRVLSHKEPHVKLTWDWVENDFIHFFNTEEFQQWSMTNPDKKVREKWNTYKWPAKDIIYEYTKDEAYWREKTKVPSLPGMLRYRKVYNFITEDLEFLHTIDLKDYIK